MAKQRGYPDRRGMGAQSDFISESFVPSDRHKEQLLMGAETQTASSCGRTSVDECFMWRLNGTFRKSGRCSASRAPLQIT